MKNPQEIAVEILSKKENISVNEATARIKTDFEHFSDAVTKTKKQLKLGKAKEEVWSYLLINSVPFASKDETFRESVYSRAIELFEGEQKKKEDKKTEVTDENKETNFPISEEEQKEIEEKLKSVELINHIHSELDKKHKIDHREKLALFIIAVSSELPRADDHQSAALKGNSSAGKDSAMKTALSLFPPEENMFLTRATTAALEDEIQNAKRIAFSEINKHRENGANSDITEIFKQMSEGGIKIMKKSQEERGKTLNIQTEQKTLFYGTTETESDEELETRYVIIPIRSSLIKNQIVVNDVLDKAATMNEGVSSNSWVVKAIRLLKQNKYDVVIPFATLFKEPIQDGDSKKYLFDFGKDRIKRDAKRLMALTRAIAWLHQKQRVIKDNVIIAEPYDFLLTLTIFAEFFNLTYKGLDHRLQDTLDKIGELEGKHKEDIKTLKYPDHYNTWVLRNKLQDVLKLNSVNALKGRIERLKDSGLIDVHYDQNIPSGYLLRIRGGVSGGVSDLSLPVSLIATDTLLTGWVSSDEAKTIYQNKHSFQSLKDIQAFFDKLTGVKLTGISQQKDVRSYVVAHDKGQGVYVSDIPFPEDVIKHTASVKGDIFEFKPGYYKAL